MSRNKIIMLCVTLFCSVVAIFAEDNIACYSTVENWYFPDNKLGGQFGAEVKILKRDNNSMQIEFDKYILPFEIVEQTVDAKLQDGKYVFYFTDGWANRSKGFVQFDGENKLVLDIEIIQRSDVPSSVGRVYGDALLEKCVTAQYMESSYWQSATAEQIRADIKSGKLRTWGTDTEGEDVLMIAAKYSSKPEVINELIAQGDVDAHRDRVSQATALMLAAKNNGNSAIISELIKAGADVNARDRWGKSVLMYASSTKNPDIINILVKAGAKINDRALYGQTVLMYAADGVSLEVFTALLKAGAKVDVADEEGQTVLMYFLKNENTDVAIIKQLIAAGANVNAQNDNLHSALMFAAENTHYPEVITSLLDAGADPNVKDEDGKTAWDYIQENYHLGETAAYTALDAARKK